MDRDGRTDRSSGRIRLAPQAEGASPLEGGWLAGERVRAAAQQRPRPFDGERLRTMMEREEDNALTPRLPCKSRARLEVLQWQPGVDQRAILVLVEKRWAAAGGQPSGHVGVAVLGRRLLGRADRRLARSTEGRDDLGALEAAVLARLAQRRDAVRGGFVDVGAGVAKHAHALGVALLACQEQRRVGQGNADG